MDDTRGISKLVYPDPEVGPERMVDPPVIFVGQFSGTGIRTKDELKKHFGHVGVNSVQELCRTFDVRIEGQYVDPDGTTQSVAFQAVDESSFTPTGLTLQDPELYRMYIEKRLCDHVGSMNTPEADGRLTEEQISQLDADIEQLECAGQGGV